MKWIDMPPVWLLACLVLAWSVPVRFAPGALVYLGWVAIIFGALLMALAFMEFRRAQTTIIPREAPNALIQSGIYRFTRNPIYLADTLFLAGAALIWGSIPGLLLVPVFIVVIQRRFIHGEEAMLRATYGAAFEDYARRVRRWL